jgi:hypothetical protein
MHRRVSFFMVVEVAESCFHEFNGARIDHVRLRVLVTMSLEFYLLNSLAVAHALAKVATLSTQIASTQHTANTAGRSLSR